MFEVIVRDESAIVGKTVQSAIDESQFDADIVQLIRDGEQFFEGIASKRIRPEDILTVRTDRKTLGILREQEGLDLVGTQLMTRNLNRGRKRHRYSLRLSSSLGLRCLVRRFPRRRFVSDTTQACLHSDPVGRRYGVGSTTSNYRLVTRFSSKHQVIALTDSVATRNSSTLVNLNRLITVQRKFRGHWVFSSVLSVSSGSRGVRSRILLVSEHLLVLNLVLSKQRLQGPC